jgi:hypothetical protein
MYGKPAIPQFSAMCLKKVVKRGLASFHLAFPLFGDEGKFVELQTNQAELGKRRQLSASSTEY